MKKFLLASAGVLCMTLSAHAAENLLFEETFANCKSTTIQGGYFTESLYFDAPTMGDNNGWYTQNCYMSERAIKFSAKTKHGKATSPVITTSGENPGTVTVNFRAQNWTGDDLTINVSIAGHPEMTKTVDVTGKHQISDRSEEYSSVTFENVDESFQLEFSGTGKEGGTGVTRFFLSDIQVIEEVPVEIHKPWLRASTAYHHFDDIMAGNQSEKRTVFFEATGYSASEIYVEMPDRSNFKYTLDALDLDCDVPTSTAFIVFEFDPRSAGSIEEVAVFHAGDLTRNIILTGNAKVYRPEAMEPFEIGSDSAYFPGFIAPGIEEAELVVWTLEEGPLVSPDLMITKYIEGKSNNRALEIFNGTGKTVSLDGYRLLMESNGAGGLTACEFAFPDVELAPGKCYTIANAQFGAVRDIADKTIGYQDGGYANIMTFTGDDAIGLFNPAGELIDLVGYESTDVNDRVSGVWGTDVSYYRRPEAYMPTPKFYVSEWIAYPIDYCEGFGAHEMDTYGDVRNVVYSHRDIVDLETNAVYGLTPATTYYYAVRGFSNGIVTPFSPVKSFTTLDDPGSVDGVTEDALYEIEGETIILAENAEAWTIDGICLGTGTIRLEGHGLLVIRRGSASAKLRY